MTSKLSFSIPASKSSKSKLRPSSQTQPHSDQQQSDANGTKLSFSIPSDSHDGIGYDNNDRKQYVTEFDSSKTLADPDKSQAVIAPIQNTWRPIKRMKNLELPLSDSANSEGIGFVVETLPTANGGGTQGDGGISYGLNLRHKGSKDETEGGGEGGGDTETVLLEKLRHDLENLPQDRGMEEFEDRPVEGFGAALLAGYGWKEGQGIGRNAKEDVKVKQYEKRVGKLGLGFVPDKSDVIAIVNASKDRRNYKERSRESKDRGDASSKKDRVSKEYDNSGLGNGTHGPRGESGKGKRDSGDVRGRRVAWLRRQIRVRIISKKFKGGKFYLKKGVVVDVVEPHICDISMDESGELVQGVDQDLLETALPRKGGPVLVLYDEHKGLCGNLVRRDLDCGVGVVEDPHTLELLNIKLDQIAEYVGDPSYM